MVHIFVYDGQSSWFIKIKQHVFNYPVLGFTRIWLFCSIYFLSMRGSHRLFYCTEQSHLGTLTALVFHVTDWYVRTKARSEAM